MSQFLISERARSEVHIITSILLHNINEHCLGPLLNMSYNRSDKLAFNGCLDLYS